MNSYDNFSAFYDAAMGDRTKTALRLRNLITRDKSDAKTVLELACGTGAVLVHLAKDYEVSGLDLSAEMLSVARKRVPQARFFQADMVTFDVGKKFDIILCVFDSINHILEFADWERIFRRVDAHLLENGLFIFDINTEHKLQRLIKERPSVEKFGDNLLIVEVNDEGRGVCTWNIKIFEPQKANIYKLFEEEIRERSFPVGRIKEALLKQFKSVRVLDPKRQRISSQSDRLYFVCKKGRQARA